MKEQIADKEINSLFYNKRITASILIIYKLPITGFVMSGLEIRFQTPIV